MIKTYAELLYGKVNYIESTTLNIGELAKKYSPTTNCFYDRVTNKYFENMSSDPAYQFSIRELSDT